MPAALLSDAGQALDPEQLEERAVLYAAREGTIPQTQGRWGGKRAAAAANVALPRCHSRPSSLLGAERA